MPIINAQTKPITVQCLEWTGNNVEEVSKFCNNCNIAKLGTGDILISALDGVKRAVIGDYILKNGCMITICDKKTFSEKYDILDCTLI